MASTPEPPTEWATLREKAEAATPGPWRYSPVYRPPLKGSGEDVLWGYSISGSDEHGASILPTLAMVHNFPNQTEANAAYIAEASPDRVLALLDALWLAEAEAAAEIEIIEADRDRLAGEVERLRARLDNIRDLTCRVDSSYLDIQEAIDAALAPQEPAAVCATCRGNGSVSTTEGLAPCPEGCAYEAPQGNPA